MELNKIYCGDNLDILKTFPNNSINCCITSPPYYGLRDYGTGKWIGGDPNCPHKRLSKYSPNTTTGHAQEELIGNVGDAIYKSVCPLCGAVREDKQVGLEETPEEYIDRLVRIFREVKRVLKNDGTLWVNIGDSYNSAQTGSIHSEKQKTNKGSFSNLYTKKLVDNCKPKDLIGIPWMLAFALRADGWYLRQDIIWSKPNPMPESVKDRCTKSHEYIFLLSKSSTYYFDYESIKEIAAIQNAVEARFGGNKYSENEDRTLYHRYSGNEYKLNIKDGLVKRQKRDVWTIKPSTFSGAHFATFPEELVKNCLMAGCPANGVILDPFMGSGTVGLVAKNNGRNYVGIDLNQNYVDMAEKRIEMGEYYTVQADTEDTTEKRLSLW